MLDNMLDKMTCKKTQAKKKQKREKSQKVKITKNVERGKIKLDDMFNEKVSDDDYIKWRKYLNSNRISKIEIIRKMKTIKVSDIGYKPKKVKGLMCIVHFIECVDHCINWLEEHFNEIGWVKNITGYNPCAVSHSVNELLVSTIECYKIGLKQMLKVYEYEEEM